MTSTSTPAINIRHLAQPDLPSVLRIAEGASEASHWPRQTFVQMLSGEFLSRRLALVATVAGDVIGFAVASIVAPESELENIAVAPNAQRRGIGRLLLSELVKELKKTGELRKSNIETLHLEVRISNSAAIGLYNSFGFNETGRRPSYYSHPVEDAVLMTLHFG
jgi:ribosomal-protein-alanine N-acetyltransferase